MAIPDYQTCMLPFLRHLGDEKEHSLRDTEEALAEFFKLTSAELDFIHSSRITKRVDKAVKQGSRDFYDVGFVVRG